MHALSVEDMATHAATRFNATGHDDDPISIRVAMAVADFKGIEPTELETPLYDVVDVEAMDALFRSADDTPQLTGYISFVVDGCEVFVDGSGDVTVESA